MPQVPQIVDRAKSEEMRSPMVERGPKPSDAHLLMAAASMHAMDRLHSASRKPTLSPVKNGKA